MNLPNVFGMHLGCKVRVPRFDTNEDYFLHSVQRRGWVIVSFSVEYREAKIEDIKLLLKPLSSMSEEHKMEFEEEFTIGNKVKEFSTNEEGDIVFCSEFEDWEGDPMDVWENISYEQLVWLTSNGYHIEKLLPREYVEIQEVEE